MDIGKKIEQYGVMAVGLMVGFGFMFGIVFSYSGMISSSGGGQGGDTEFDGELPSDNYVEGSFELSQREQYVLAAENDVVFVNAFYETEDQLEDLRQLESLPEDFNGRVYVQVAGSGSGSTLSSKFRIQEYPTVVALGSSQSSPAVKAESIAVEDVESSVCDVMRNWGDSAVRCT